MTVLRSSERFAVSQPGIETRHCFSAGPHYDPERLGVGALIAVDEHVLAPGAEFAEHTHRGVDIVSWVASGVLRHNNAVLVRPGEVFVQRTGSGIRHVEGNGSDEPLRLVQMTLLVSADTAYAGVEELPVTLDGGRLDVLRSGARTLSAPAYVFVVHGRFDWDGTTLTAGDSASPAGDTTVRGDGELLVWELG